MIATKPNVEPKGLYNITQAAAALGVSRYTISRYIANGSIKFNFRKADRRRITTGEQIVKCWQSTFI